MDNQISITLESNKDEVLRATNEQIRRALEAIGLAAQGYAVDGAPLDTGRLRNSITSKVVDNDVYIGTNVEYAPYMEFGKYTAREQGGPHFLRNAASNHADEYRKTLEAALKS